MKSLFQIILIALFFLIIITNNAFAFGASVPEPATALLFGLGLLGIAAVSRRIK